MNFSNLSYEFKSSIPVADGVRIFETMHTFVRMTQGSRIPIYAGIPSKEVSNPKNTVSPRSSINKSVVEHEPLPKQEQVPQNELPQTKKSSSTAKTNDDSAKLEEQQNLRVEQLIAQLKALTLENKTLTDTLELDSSNMNSTLDASIALSQKMILEHQEALKVLDSLILEENENQEQTQHQPTINEKTCKSNTELSIPETEESNFAKQQKCNTLQESIEQKNDTINETPSNQECERENSLFTPFDCIKRFLLLEF